MDNADNALEVAQYTQEQDGLGAVIQALQDASDRLGRLRSAARVNGALAPDVVASIDAEGERLRALLERRPLETGCDPRHEEFLAPAVAPEAQPPAELLARLDELDIEAEDALEALRTGVLLAGTAPGKARTFVDDMEGRDVRAWQRQVNRQLTDWRIAHAIDTDGIYGPKTQRWSKRVLYGLGQSIADWNGVTPQARIKARHLESRTPDELAAAKARRPWLRRLRRQYAAKRVHTPVKNIIHDDWGYTAGHDGIDLICPPNAQIFAVCRAKVIDVRAGGWWGKNPTGDVSRGDGIIQLEALTSIGPLKKGMHIGYGHAEHARVSVGQVVRAGTVLGKAGLANAWHVHFMINGGGTIRGIGDRDPRPYLDLFTGRTSR
jgi:murein DD-endopeptidase MepM/ murein hydrolase activator NlpD